MSTEETAALVARRLELIAARDVDALIAYYTADSVIFTPDGPVRGLEAIRGLFEAFFAGPFAEEVRRFEVLRQDCEGEFAYLLWSAETATASIPLATDSFVVRDGAIVQQSVAAHFVPTQGGEHERGDVNRREQTVV